MIFGVIVSVPVAPDNPRHFGLSSRQRTLRTRGSPTICRKNGSWGRRSGSGESWFNFLRDAVIEWVRWEKWPGEVSPDRSEEHTSELQSRLHLVCRLLLEKKKT